MPSNIHQVGQQETGLTTSSSTSCVSPGTSTSDDVDASIQALSKLSGTNELPTMCDCANRWDVRTYLKNCFCSAEKPQKTKQRSLSGLQFCRFERHKDSIIPSSRHARPISPPVEHFPRPDMPARQVLARRLGIGCSSNCRLVRCTLTDMRPLQNNDGTVHPAILAPDSLQTRRSRSGHHVILTQRS